MPGERLSNVVGAPFPEFVLTQLQIRQNRGSNGTGPGGRRSNAEVLYLANKMSWVKLTSSVNITPSNLQYADLTEWYQAYGLDTNTYKDKDSLRKNWILQAGTSFSTNSNGITLRKGLGPEGAYGIGGTESSGYRPMPGLTNVTIESKGTLGSLREANVEFKVWNIEQLNIIEAIYFRLGYSMLLEWGHVQYFDNLSPRNVDGTFTVSDGGIDAFTDVRKEYIQQQIGKKRKNTDGNYDGMLGIVSNFTWSYNQEGGYDCTLKIIGLGSIIDTLRINLSYKMPDVIFIDYEKQQKSIEKEIKEKAERERKLEEAKLRNQILDQQRQAANAQVAGLPPLPTKRNEIYAVYEYDVKKNNPPKPLLNPNEFQVQNSYYSQLSTIAAPAVKIGNQPIINAITLTLNALIQPNQNANFLQNVYYKATGTDALRLNNKRTGLFLSQPFLFIPADVAPNYPQPVSVNAVALSQRIDYIFQNFGRSKFLGFGLPVGLSDIYDLYFSTRDNFAVTNYIKETDNILGDIKAGLNIFNVYQKSYNFGLDSRYSNKREYGDGTTSLSEEIAVDFFNTARSKPGRYGFTGEKQISIVYTYQETFSVFDVNNVPNRINEQRAFYFAFKYIPQPNQPYTNVQIAKLIQDWFKSATPVYNITGLDSTDYVNDRTAGTSIVTQFFSTIPPGTNTYKDLVINGTLDLKNFVPAGTIPPIIQLTTNDPFFITGVLARPDPVTTIPMNGQVGGGGTTVIVINNANAPQQDESQKFASALHAMLYAVKSEVQTQAKKYPKLTGNKISIFDLTKKFFADGVLGGVFETTAEPNTTPINITTRQGVPGIQIPRDVPFDLIPYAKKGFASSLMADPSLYTSIEDVDFKSLCTASYIKFNIQDNTNPYNYPVYIKFGYLLAFLNSMCLIYDSKQDTDKRPYVYLDFNPDYNFCLTSPYHLSVDPLTCMIPYQGNTQQYKELFPPGVRNEVLPDFPSDQVAKEKGLTPQKNLVSQFIPEFKSPDNAYQGKIMEILLSVDFLLDTLKSFTSNDPAHAINLKGFLDAVVVGINKSCGNINLFRVSYDDESNTVVIKDDQFVPNRADEPTIINVERAKQSTIRLGNARYGMIPIFGLNSMVRDFEFKTNVNTAMSKQIAISAQAQRDAVNQTDHSSFSWLNRDYVDAYKPQVLDSTRLTDSSNNSTKSNKTQVDKDQAEKFNSHILAIYQGDGYLNPGRIDFAINYYISSMADRKALDPTTYAAPFISANLSMTIDGISGITMGNAFTVPEDRLPISLRGNGISPKVGFIVSGLTHTLDNNQWLTKIKGQMIRLTDVLQYSTPTQQLGTQLPAPPKSNLPAGEGMYKPCEREYDANGKQIKGYIGTAQVPAPESINRNNVKDYYPYLAFVRGTNSDIPVRNDIPTLTTNEIVDDTGFNRFDIGVISANPKYFVIHHTAGSGTAEDVYKVFYCRGLPAQYVIDRQGVIHQFMPDGTRGLHAGGYDPNGTEYNNTSIGVEIIATSDSDVLDIQVRAAVRLARYLGFNKDQVVGHGPISKGRKAATEGAKVVNYIKTL